MTGTGRAISIVAILLMAGPPAVGQHYVQQGNVLDANNRLGSGGLNYTTRQYQPNSANRYITGNAGGGASFRGFSPIRDASSMFLGSSTGSGLLGSDSLSNFTRDSYSVGDAMRGREYSTSVGGLYYSPQSTVANTGAIVSGLNRPGTSQLRSSFIIPRADLNASPTNPLTGVVNRRLLRSPLFGAVRRVPLTEALTQAEKDASLDTRTYQTLDMRFKNNEPVDLRANRLLDLRTDRRADDPTSSRLFGTEQPDAGQVAGGGLRMMEGSSLRRQIGIQPDRSDVFGQMQSEVTGLPAGGPAFIRPAEVAPSAVSEQPGAEAGTAEPSAGQTPTHDVVLRTFVGTTESVFNSYMAEAEKLLKTGQFYSAVNSYTIARTVDKRNPLPLVGRSMALLAAGDYLTSATDLFESIRMFESLALFKIDIKAFVPDLRALDRRRADLEHRLERSEDFRLRFLLGYAEYCSGLDELGLANMQKAAESLPEKLTAVRRFVQILHQRYYGATAPVEVPSNQ